MPNPISRRDLLTATALLPLMTQTNPKPAPAPAVPREASVAYPIPTPPTDKDALGRGIQRTMTLLATSTPARRNRVRILFYGQSITEQDWSKRVADDLRRRFPHADLEIENRAIGGFASQLLIRPAEHDLYPFYPDLVIFHVYGANDKYEEIIRNIRARTTAEVLMQKDHVAAAGVTDKPDEKADKGLWWDWTMNHQFLPDIAKKYGCGLVDVRAGWLDYLQANDLKPQALLKDGVHLNDHGNFLMAELVKRYLVSRPDLPKGDWQNLVRTVVVGKDVTWKNGRLTVPFEGNRVDVITAPGTAARVLIDGKAPSALPGLYRITRPQPNPWSPLALVRVDHDKPLIAENWTLKITSVNADSSRWTFDVSGSVTGADGSGASDAPFVSQSGRVKIEPASFFRNPNAAIPNGYQITWQVLPTFTDTITPPKAQEAGRDYPITVAQGLTNGPHTLEIIAGRNGGSAPVQAVRVYRPPVR
jgi:hypothetical protein